MAIAKIVSVGTLVLFAGCSLAQNESPSLIAPGAEVQKLYADFVFIEGPVADNAGNVYFSDVRASRIHKIDLNGKLSTVRESTNMANGLIFDGAGNLIACEGGAKRITSMSADGTVTIVAEKFEGKPFNSPNDLWIDNKGGIYFTDPNYRGEENASQDGEHVYYLPPDYLAPDKKTLTRVVSDMGKPNGIILTPDNARLYVADTQLGKVFAFDVNADGSLGPKQAFADTASDGMTLDEMGNLYTTWAGKVSIFNPQGTLLETISVPENPANVAFGGKDHNTLFITARTGLYSIQMAVKGTPKIYHH